MLPSEQSSLLNGTKGAPGFRPYIIPSHSAWRILRRRTGGNISRATFYRWVSSGKLGSVRLGERIYIPLPALDDFIRKCMSVQ